MTNFFTQAAADVEAEWNKIEGIVEADVVTIANAAKGFFISVEPELLAALSTLASAAIADLMGNPAAAFTTLLGQAENMGSALWNTLEPQAKTVLLNTVAGMVTLPATIAAPVAAPAT